MQIQRKQRRQLEQLRRRQKSNIIFFLHDGWLHFESESGLTVFHSRSLNGIKKKAACILSWSMIFKWIKFFAIQEAWHCYKFILNACLARVISLWFEFLWSCSQWWEWFAGINVCLALNQCKWFLSLCLL